MTKAKRELLEQRKEYLAKQYATAPTHTAQCIILTEYVKVAYKLLNGRK